jgi:sterol desaturase/sphingolipid hydroxylase (fatty acid hydroxylase superfamily)
MQYIQDFTGDLLSYFTNPNRKTYYLYFFSSLIIGITFLYITQLKNESFREKLNRYVFNKEHWFSKSAYCDYGYVVLNGLIRVTLIIPFMMTGMEMTFSFAKWLMLTFGIPQIYEGPSWIIITCYTLSLWLLSDFTRFFLHYLAHKIPFLWELHKVHHSATVMNPFTLYRQHPVEMFLFYIRGALVFAFVTGIFYYYFSYSLGIIEIIGVNIGRFIFLILGSNLRHSHIPLSFGKYFEFIFISPLQHQIHHSDKQVDYDKNMGSHLAIWDWMFGTLKISKKEERTFTFGLSEKDNYAHRNLISSLFTPFKNIFSFRSKK